jgi:hypothetical protein
MRLDDGELRACVCVCFVCLCVLCVFFVCVCVVCFVCVCFVCVCFVCVSMCVCMLYVLCVCVCVFYLLIKHAPLPWVILHAAGIRLGSISGDTVAIITRYRQSVYFLYNFTALVIV